MPLPHGGHPHQTLPGPPAEPASGTPLPLTASSVQSDRHVMTPRRTVITQSLRGCASYKRQLGGGGSLYWLFSLWNGHCSCEHGGIYEEVVPRHTGCTHIRQVPQCKMDSVLYRSLNWLEGHQASSQAWQLKILCRDDHGCVGCIQYENKLLRGAGTDVAPVLLIFWPLLCRSSIWRYVHCQLVLVVAELLSWCLLHLPCCQSQQLLAQSALQALALVAAPEHAQAGGSARQAGDACAISKTESPISPLTWLELVCHRLVQQ